MGIAPVYNAPSHGRFERNQDPEFVDSQGDIYQTGFDDYNVDYTNSKRREDSTHHQHHNPIGGHHLNQFTATPQHHGHHDENHSHHHNDHGSTGNRAGKDLDLDCYCVPAEQCPSSSPC